MNVSLIFFFFMSKITTEGNRILSAKDNFAPRILIKDRTSAAA